MKSTKIGRLIELVPIGLMILLMVVVFWPMLTGGVLLNTGVVYSDLWMFNYPLKDWYRQMLLSGKLPFWTSMLGNGFPVFSELQVGALYPFNLLFYFLFDTPLAFNLSVAFHFMLAAIFTYLFARVSLERSKAGSLIASLAYSLSGFWLIHIHQINILLVVAYVPLVFLCVERLVKTKRAVWVFLLGIIFMLQVLAGYIEMFYYTVLLSFGFLLFVAFLFPESMKSKENSKAWVVAGYILAVILGLGGSAMQVLPTWELTQISQRSEGLGFEDAAATRWPIETLAFFVNPSGFQTYQPDEVFDPGVSEYVVNRDIHGYVGILTLLLAFIAVVVFRKRFVSVFFIMLVTSLIYGMGKSTQLFVILWELVPGLKYFRYPIKILFFIELCLAVLAGYGFDGLVEKYLKKKADKKSMKVFSVVVLLIIFMDLYFNNVQRIQQIVPSEEWFRSLESVEFLNGELDKKQFRVYSHGTNNIDYALTTDFEMQKQFRNILPVDYSIIYGIPENREWFALLLDRQTKMNGERTVLNPETGVLSLSETFKKSLALQSVKFLVADLPIDDPDMTLVKKIPFSREVGHVAHFASGGGIQKVMVPAKGTHIYRYDEAYPRAVFVSSAWFAGSGDEAYEAILSEDFDPLREVILEEKADWGEEGVNGEVEIAQDEENWLELRVESEGDGYLVLADTYYPGWKAYIDGEETEVLRANYNFKTVKVPSGKHKVYLEYEPTHWRLGVIISVISIAITALGLGYSLFKRNK